MTYTKRIIHALDISELNVDTWSRIRDLAPILGGFKVGLEAFIRFGPSFVSTLVKSVKSHNSFVMLDLKLHDIPETVERAVLAAGELGVDACTLHVQQRETMRRAVGAADKTNMLLLAVTVLTSMTDDDLQVLWGEGLTCSGKVEWFTHLANQEGIHGFVASPQEAPMIKKAYPFSTIVAPGIRPAGSEAGDQKRTTTPAQANHADYLVIGRPIRDAADPVKAAEAIDQEIKAALENKS